MKIRIAYIINNLQIGGAEKLLLSIIKNIDKNQFDITVIPLLNNNDLLHQFLTAGAKVIELRMRNKRDLLGFFRLYNYIKRLKFHIVHTHLIEADIIGRYAALLANTPIIVSTEHSVNLWKKHPKKIKTKARCFLDRLATKYADSVITVSQSIKRYLVESVNIDSSKIIIIKNGIQIPNIKNMISKSTKSERICLGAVGRLCDEKGYQYLLNAFKNIIKIYPKIQLSIAGDGPNRDKLIDLCKDLNISNNVHLLGIVSNILSFLENIDIFVMSSLREGIPLSLLEAMVLKKAVIATKTGGIPEVIQDNHEGILITPKNIPELEKAMLFLIKNNEKRKQLGYYARMKVLKNFNINNTVLSLEKHYQKLIKTKLKFFYE